MMQDSPNAPLTANPPLNRYCERAGLTSVPAVENFVRKPDILLFHLMVVALLEHGEAMTLEKLVDRLERAGVAARTGDLASSLKKAWHGRPPVYRDASGRYGIDLSSSELKRMIDWRIGMRPLPFTEGNIAAGVVQPDDKTSLTEEELRAAFERHAFVVSTIRQVAAILDVHNRTMTRAEVDSVLGGITQHHGRLTDQMLAHWQSRWVHIDEGERLTLDRDAPEAAAMRREIRRIAYPILQRRALEHQWAIEQMERDAARAEMNLEHAKEAARLRRAIVRALPEAGAPEFIAILDTAGRSIQTLAGARINEAARLLEGFDLLIGLEIRETLYALGLDADRWRLVDLKPPKKSHRLNRRGQTLSITPELLITSTTGISRPLADPAKIAEYLASGSTGKLVRRIESDVKALHAFYSYGVLHRCVRLRWGFLNEVLHVDWAVPGDTALYDFLNHARRKALPVEVVVGSAPGFADPWSRARRAAVVRDGPWGLTVQIEDEDLPRHDREIQAIRLYQQDKG